MPLRKIFRAGRRLVRRLLRVLTRPVRGDAGRGGVLIQAYRGYGSPQQIYLMGRVFRQPALSRRQRSQPGSHHFSNVFRRIARRGVKHAEILATINVERLSPIDCQPANSWGQQFYNCNQKIISQRVRADRDGYFHIRWQLPQPVDENQQWHSVTLKLVAPAKWTSGPGATAEGQVYIPPASARRVIISDIDDTVVFTGVANKVMMFWRLFMQGPQSRLAFPGVAAFYRGLHDGPADESSSRQDKQPQANPMLYVSRGPWSIYEILQEFFRIHRIPVGPILFLREWGLTLQRPWPRRAEDHKLTLIREMLSLYDALPVVLIGDSGQRDPEIYAQVVAEYPGRVAAVYIRDVSDSPQRTAAIKALAERVLADGSTLVLAADSTTMAKHAAEHQLISRQALELVTAEKEAEESSVRAESAYELHHSDNVAS